MKTTDPIPQPPVPREATVISVRARFAYALMFGGLITLAISGIGSFIAGKVPMAHWILMLHVGAAPFFAVGLALVALTWSGPSSFAADAPAQSCKAKLLFWLMLICGLVVVLTGVLPMTPIFGTPGQDTLYLTHRYSSIVLTGIVGLHLLSLGRAKR
jgi:hypothetical protein